MPRNHKPTEVSQAITQRNGDKYPILGNGCCCSKSPTGYHLWAIESPSGKTSIGMCKYCGERKEFANTLEAAFKVRRNR